MTNILRVTRRRMEVVILTVMIPAAILLTVQHCLSSYEQILNNARVQATLIGDSASAALAFNDEQTAQTVVTTAKRMPQARIVALYLANGDLLAYSADGEAPPSRIMLAPQSASRLSPSTLELDQPVWLGEELVGSVRMRIGLDLFYEGLLKFVGGLALTLLITTGLYILASRRIHQRMEEAENALRHMALHDRVTGLANRYAFELSLEQVLQRFKREGGSAALLFVDVDGFKKVNDLFGHHVGDGVLLEIGQRFKSCLREADILARLGGDEFGVITSDIGHAEHAARIAENLIRRMEAPFNTDAHPVHLGVSVGITLLPGNGDSSEVLLAQADTAMYQAKKEGKNTYRFFSDAIGDAVRARLNLELELRTAVLEDQFFLHYQPQVDVNNGLIVGMEALIRWRHPLRGSVPPGEFIPVAEDSDLILEVGHWVLQRVCRDIKTLENQGRVVPPVAVNVSARQFVRSPLAADIRATLAEHGLDARHLEIELTESVVMDHTSVTTTTLDELQHSGLRLAVDDFGTGYSSLAYLKRLPVDKLKIDRSFVIPLGENTEDQAIVSAIIGVAQALNLKVIAEGVETDIQASVLRKLGCHIIQGYLTGRPMPLEDIASLLPPACLPPAEPRLKLR